MVVNNLFLEREFSQPTVYGIQSSIDEIQSSIDEIQSSIDKINETGIGGLQSSIDNINTNISGIQSTVGGIQNTLRGEQGKVTGLQTSVTNIQNTLRGEQGKVTALQTNLAKIQSIRVQTNSAAAINMTGNEFNFYINLAANSAITCTVNASSVGKSGQIIVQNANRITGFSAPFNWRIPQSGFTGTEIFSYYVVATNLVRIVRS